jgi:predicted metal-dependent peptidase
VSDHEVVRFNSEVKHIKETFNPGKLTLVQFDEIIQDEKIFLDTDPFEELVVIGRGGTSLVKVREHILKHKPNAVIVFSDLACPVMEKLPQGSNIPIIWVCINNTKATVNEGKLIHIRE